MNLTIFKWCLGFLKKPDAAEQQRRIDFDRYNHHERTALHKAINEDVKL